MTKIAFVRGAYLNNFEGQNYHIPGLIGFGSLHSIHQEFPFPIVRLPSFSDYNVFGRWGRVIANRAMGDIQNLFGLEKYASQFDLFHTADPHYYYSYQLARLRAANKIKHLLVTSWETIPFNNETVETKKRNKYFVLKHADHFLCYTLRAKECLILEGVAEKKITVIRLGVDLNRFVSQKSNVKSQKLMSKVKGIKILFVGRLVEGKGVMDAYEAFRNVKGQISSLRPSESKGFAGQANIKLQIVGEGPLKQTLLRKIEEDHLRDCVSIETKKYEEMPKIYHNADVVLLPSKRTNTWEEQYGMVFVEAMASGKPILAYNTGSISEILNTPGVLSNSKAKLQETLLRLIGNRKERVKLGTINRKRAEKLFDCKKTAKKIEKLYISLCKR